MAVVYSWGRGEDGQLGLGDTNDQDTPVAVDALRGKEVSQIACGSGHTVVLTEVGEVFTWGRGDDGRLGHGDNGWKYVPRPVQALAGKVVVQITCGSYHTAAVTEGGELYTWGGGMYGKLGHGNETGHSTPCRVEALSGVQVRQIACGSRHTAVLTDQGEVYTWGDKENGVVGHGDTEGHQYLPRVLEPLRNKPVKQIAACGFHTSVLTDRGEAYTWGEGKFGRLGHGTERNQTVPRMIEALMGKRMGHVASGGFHSAAITESGNLYTWGGGEHGQLGHGDKVNKTTPCLVEALRDKVLVQITCGWSHTVALTDDGKVYTWGNGDHGKLGHGDTLKVTTPRLVEPLQNMRVVKVASYNEHTAALTDPSATAAPTSMSSSFLADLKSMIDNSDFSDITFVVEGQNIHAHKGYLAVRCEHFRAMFSSGMRESRENEVIIPNIRYPIFLALLEYIYTDMTDITPENAIDLYNAADLYTLDRLKVLCEMSVQKGINFENAATLLQNADESHATRLREICMNFIIRHFDTVTKSEGFKSLSRELILETLANR
mmetsp:Transcript_18157/g.23892  ORF Transcript_18157/g.23892 Transcript_18157/m.23892 type:complete len:547 (+) Transcript_18157:211-1851(+)